MLKYKLFNLSNTPILENKLVKKHINRNRIRIIEKPINKVINFESMDNKILIHIEKIKECKSMRIFPQVSNKIKTI
jgi:hypothetical protein